MTNPKRIAIIGAGISGLSAAYLLHKDNQVTLYEKAERLGGHTRTIDVNYDGTKIPVDTGFIVFNLRNYYHLTRFFKRLCIKTQKSDMSFAASIDDGQIEWAGSSLSSLFAGTAKLTDLSFWKGLADVLRFNRKALRFIALNPDASLGEMLDIMKFGPWFRNNYLLPMGAAIWSCPIERIIDFPAASFVHFFENHGLLQTIGQPQWYTVTNGSINYVKAIADHLKDSIKLNADIIRIERSDNKILITTVDQKTEIFDHVVLSCHADQALKLLTEPSAEERSFLDAFAYTTNRAYLHRDINQMPKIKRCWASWNYLAETKEGSYGKEGALRSVSVTYWMNKLQSIDFQKPLFVTLNPIRTIAPEFIFDVYDFEHPVFDGAAIAAQKKLKTIQGKKNTWFCGAYQGYGFHEDGIKSAVQMVKEMGFSIPW